MTALPFLLVAVAMIVAVRGRRGIAVGQFGVSFVLCGPVECTPDPAGYWIAKYLP